MILSLKICEIKSVKKSIFSEIARIDEQLNNLRNEFVIEESKAININKIQIKFYLKQIKNGSINDIHCKKAVISTLINKVFLYDGTILIVFSVSETPYKSNIPSINEIESSLMGRDALLYACIFELLLKSIEINIYFIKSYTCWKAVEFLMLEIKKYLLVYDDYIKGRLELICKYSNKDVTF